MTFSGAICRRSSSWLSILQSVSDFIIFIYPISQGRIDYVSYHVPQTMRHPTNQPPNQRLLVIRVYSEGYGSRSGRFVRTVTIQRTCSSRLPLNAPSHSGSPAVTTPTGGGNKRGCRPERGPKFCNNTDEGSLACN